MRSVIAFGTSVPKIDDFALDLLIFLGAVEFTCCAGYLGHPSEKFVGF